MDGGREEGAVSEGVRCLVKSKMETTNKGINKVFRGVYSCFLNNREYTINTKKITLKKARNVKKRPDAK